MVVNIEELKTDAVGMLNEALTEDAKKALLVYIRDNLLPVVKTVGEKYISQLKDEALSETGWTRFRDTIFLPLAIEAAICGASTVIDKMIERS